MFKFSSAQVKEINNLNNWFSNRLFDDIVMVDGLSHSEIVKRYDNLVSQVKSKGYKLWVIKYLQDENESIISQIESFRSSN